MNLPLSTAFTVSHRFLGCCVFIFICFYAYFDFFCDLLVIQKHVVHPKIMNFTFFSSAHRTFSRIDHILGHKSNLEKFKKTEIILSIFSDHNALRLDLSYRRKTITNSNIWRLNNMLLDNQQITEEIKKEIKICIEMNENENTTTQNLWDTIKAVLRGKFIAIEAYLKKQEKSQINNLGSSISSFSSCFRCRVRLFFFLVS